MVETITYSRLMLQDLDLGVGTRQHRLQDGALYTLDQIPGHTLIYERRTVTPSNVAQLTATFANPAGVRVAGVTVKNLVGLGASNGLTGYHVGWSSIVDHWRNNHPVTLNAESNQSHFQSADMPIVGAAFQVLLSALGGNFDATGSIEVALWYSYISHPRA